MDISFEDDVAVILLLGVSFVLHHNSESSLPVAKFIVPDWGDKVDSGIGLSYRPATYAGRPVLQPYAGVNYILLSWTLNLDTAGKGESPTHCLFLRRSLHHRNTSGEQSVQHTWRISDVVSALLV